MPPRKKAQIRSLSKNKLKRDRVRTSVVKKELKTRGKIRDFVGGKATLNQIFEKETITKGIQERANKKAAAVREKGEPIMLTDPPPKKRDRRRTFNRDRAFKTQKMKI